VPRAFTAGAGEGADLSTWALRCSDLRHLPRRLRVADLGRSPNASLQGLLAEPQLGRLARVVDLSPFLPALPVRVFTDRLEHRRVEVMQPLCGRAFATASLARHYVRGELLKLGINVSATAVATVLRVSGLGPAPRRIGPSWSEFLRAQAQSMLGAGLPSGRGGGLEGNVSARSAATPEGAPREAEADEVFTNDADMPWPAWPPVSGLPPLSAVAALPYPCDSTAAPRLSSQQWHARDGPRTRRRSHARTGRPGCPSRRLRGRRVRAATTRRFPGPLPDPSRSPRRTTGRPTAPPLGEPSFFTPQASPSGVNLMGRRPTAGPARHGRCLTPDMAPTNC
jgi:hypothetical protein